jgi:hypothetical protein
METLGNNLGAKKGKKGHDDYYCELCDYICCKKYSWNRHLLTSKHIQETNGNNLETQKGQHNICCENCNKEFKTRSGLWKHSKICISDDNKIQNIVVDKDKVDKDTVDKKDELIDYLMKENKEIKELILELAKKDSYNNCNNNYTNSPNKAFNLNFFLNETCKDAMNIMDFVESIKLQVADLESVGELGYIEGISNIIVKNLNALDVTQRPVHCTDKKRETIYIKDDNKWEKDEEQKKMHKMIKKVADKNARLLPKFTEKYPDYKNYHSKTSDIYSKIIVESMGGSGDNDYEKEEKIIKNIAKNIMVEK